MQSIAQYHVIASILVSAVLFQRHKMTGYMLACCRSRGYDRSIGTAAVPRTRQRQASFKKGEKEFVVGEWEATWSTNG